jgi:hypothetical protein
MKILIVCFALMVISCEQENYLIQHLDGAILVESQEHHDGYTQKSRIYRMPNSTIEHSKHLLDKIFKACNLKVESEWQEISSDGDCKKILTKDNIDVVVMVSKDEGGTKIYLSELSYSEIK